MAAEARASFGRLALAREELRRCDTADGRKGLEAGTILVLRGDHGVQAAARRVCSHRTDYFRRNRRTKEDPGGHDQGSGHQSPLRDDQVPRLQRPPLPPGLACPRPRRESPAIGVEDGCDWRAACAA